MRWGIIYSPKSGVLRTHKRWEKIRKYLNEKGIAYDFVQSEGAGSEYRLGAMLANNGYKTIIIVGGDGALNSAISGALSAYPEAHNDIVFGVIPNGHGNDYAHFWDIDEEDPIKAVDVLIKGRERKVDVGCITSISPFSPTKEGELPSGDCASPSPWGRAGERFFLNCLNIGLAASIVNIKHKTYRFWGLSSLSYLSSFFLMLFHRMEHHARFTVNHETLEGSFMNICIGNSYGYGLTPNAVPYNGMLDVTTLSHPAISQLVAGMYMLVTGRLLSHRNVRPYRSRQKIRIEEIGNACISIDGQVLTDVQLPIEVSVRQEWLRFLIP